MFNPAAQDALIDLVTATVGYENAWRKRYHDPEVRLDSSARHTAEDAMLRHAQARTDAQVRLADAVGPDLAETFYAAAIAATSSVDGTRPSGNSPSVIATIIRRPHDYF